MMTELLKIVEKWKKFNDALKQKKIKEIPPLLKILILYKFKQTHKKIILITENEELICETQNLLNAYTLKDNDYTNTLQFSIALQKEGIFALKNLTKILNFSTLKSKILTLNSKILTNFEKILKIFEDFGYKRVGTVEEPGEYAVRGGIIDIFPILAKNPVRIEFFGDKIEEIREFDVETQTSIRKIDEIKIYPLKFEEFTDVEKINGFLISDNIPNLNYDLYFGDGFDMNVRSSFYGNYKIFKEALPCYRDYKKIILCKNFHTARSISELIMDAEILILPAKTGFVADDIKLAVFTEEDIFGKKEDLRKRFEKIRVSKELLHSLSEGEYCVHQDYGIGRYKGIKQIECKGKVYDCIELEYEDGKVYVPVENLYLVDKYENLDGGEPKLSRLSSNDWELKKKKVKTALEKMLKELLILYAKRKIEKGFKFSPDTPEQKIFELSFPYEETEDQLKALSDIKRDMESDFPMDRVVCGDVGFGKTELALRAAFKCVMNFKQVCFLCPTTILAEQHYLNFKERLKDFPVEIRMLSRFTSKKEEKEILKGLSDGTIDIVIGTHRLLSPDVKFKDLGLLIIDDEHKFGVRHKEKIRQMKVNVDTLSLTATPIPRTLYMALTGIRDLSVIETPPPGRKAVITQVIKWDNELIKNIIMKEIERGGQVYFIHNRITSIYNIAEVLQKLLPDVRIEVAHAKLPSRILEKIMERFMKGEIDVLVSTAIVGTGIDVPNANTIIINRADKFGLADLHQLRGRVGRSHRQAYCYLIIPRKITDKAKKRIAAIVSFAELGAGFKLAMKDLEMRGAGNVLGKEQHGFVNMIGYNLYMKLLEDTIKELKGEKKEEKIRCEVKIDRDAFFPDYYVDPNRKIALYKRLAGIEDVDKFYEFVKELKDRFGEPPVEARNLLLAKEIALYCEKFRIIKAEIGERKVRLKFKGKIDKKFLKNVFDERIRIEKVEEFVELSLSPENFLKFLKKAC